MKRGFAIALVIVVSVVGGGLLFLKSQGLFATAPVFADPHGAIRGYDPVAYFTEGRAVEGQEQFSFEWNGARWRFASAANRDRFAGAPDRYAPQFGGYCAYAVAHDHTAGSDPQAFEIVDGRLYLNYNIETQRKWAANRSSFIRDAERNWPAVLH